MLTRMKSFLAAPVFEDEDKTRIGRLLNNMLQAIFGIVLFMVLVWMAVDVQGFFSDLKTAAAVVPFLAIILGLRYLLWRGYVRPASTILSALFLGMVTFSIYNFGGISNASTSGYLLCVILAGLLIGPRGALTFAGLGIAAVFAIWGLERSGYLPPYSGDPEHYFPLMAYSTLLSITGVLLRHTAISIATALAQARRNEQAQAQANRELQALRDSLEQQVATRTRDLERRSAYMETSVKVGRAVTSILEPDQLIRQVVELVREQFGLYHVALFLVDETGRWAEYRAGTGEAGRILLEEKLCVEVGAGSLTGWCIARAQPRIAQDVQADPMHLAHPAVPDTRSEAALPLVARGRVIGALDVQSDQVGTFDQDMVAVLETIADQVAVALDNAHLFAQAQAALEAERRAYGELGRQAWAQRLREGLVTPGCRYVGGQIVPVGEAWHPEMEQALRERQSILVSPETTGAAAVGPGLTIPIQVRGQPIGVVDLHKEAGEWMPEEIALLETLTGQLGIALESARLYQDAQRLAAREQVINLSTANIRSALTVDAILQRTVEELGQAFGASRASIRLEIGEPASALT